MSRIIIDLDGTLTVDDADATYARKHPNLPVIARLNEYRARGFEIVIMTSRNMRTYNGSVGKINVNTLPSILEWLDRHDVPYDEVIVGKPWCGTDGFYVDDRAVRPSEFVSLSDDELTELVAREGRAS